jgi:hypothetical protein
MADRTTAKLFCDIFEMLAQNPTEDHKALALRVWEMTGGYDFTPNQMYAEVWLEKLGLFRILPNPTGKRCPDTEYGPLKDEPK